MRDGWSEVTLGEVAVWQKGRKPPLTVDVNLPKSRPYMTASFLRSGEVETYVPADALGACVMAPAGATLLLWDGAGAGDVFVSQGGVVASTMAVVKPIDDRLEAPYVRLVLVSRSQTLKAGNRGTGIPHVSPSVLKSVVFLLPPVVEQRRIVNLIRAVDHATGASLRLGEASRDAATAVREGCFGDDSLPAKPLSSFTGEQGIQIGPFGSQLHASDYSAAGIPVVMPQDMVDGRISEAQIAYVPEVDALRLSRHRLRAGDILLPRRGDLTKRALIHAGQEGWLCGTGSVRVRPASVEPRILFEALRTKEVNAWLEANAVGATMPNLNTAIVGRIPVRVRTEAEVVASAIEALDEHATEARALAGRLTSSKTALLAALLSGDLQLPDAYDRFLDDVA